MSVFKAIPQKMPDAVPSIASGPEGNVAKSAADAGIVPANYGGGPTIKAPLPGPSTGSPVATATVGIPVSNDDLINASRDGAVGHVPGAGEFGLFIPGLAFRGKGASQGESNVAIDAPGVAGHWTDDVEVQTNDIHSQDVDNLGWVQLHPNNRSARWLTFGQSNPLNNPTWMGQNENIGQFPVANPGVDYTAYENNNIGWNIEDGTRNFNWMANGQNVVYQTPQPPNATTTDAFTQDSYEVGVDFA
jgi:hypothetical protein